MIQVKCQKCSKIFKVHPYRIKTGRGKYCSKKCFYAVHSENMSGQNHFNYGKKASPELREKMSKAHKGKFIGEKSPTWKGGRLVKNQRYILVHSPNHPHKTKGNYVYEHRLIMEKHLGRYLKPTEEIHHKNGDPHDNRIENLVLCQNGSEHRKYHPLVHHKNRKLVTLTIY